MARRGEPSARSVRRAVDLLAQLGPAALEALVAAAIERLDAVTPDADLEEGDPLERDDDDLGSSEEEPWFWHRGGGRYVPAAVPSFEQ